MDSIPCPKCEKETRLNSPDCEHCGADLSSLKTTIASANVHFNRALEFYRSQKLNEGIIEMQAALELWGGNPKFHNLFGKILAQKGLYSRAIIQWEKALELDSNFKTAYQCIERAKRLEHFRSEREADRIPRVMFWVLGVLVLLFLITSVRSCNRAGRLSNDLEQSSSQVERLDREVVKLRAQQTAVAMVLSSQGKALPGEPTPTPKVVGQLKKQIASLEERVARKDDHLLGIQQELSAARIEKASAEKLVRNLKAALADSQQQLAEARVQAATSIEEATAESQAGAEVEASSPETSDQGRAEQDLGEGEAGPVTEVSPSETLDEERAVEAAAEQDIGEVTQEQGQQE